MTDALSELVRVGLRNPVRIVVKVESKKRKRGEGEASDGAMSERRTPARSVNIFPIINEESFTFASAWTCLSQNA